MSRYYIERMVREEAPDLRPEEVVALKPASEMMGLTLAGLMSALYRGRMTVVIEALGWGSERRRVLRAEVEAEAARRGGGV